MLKIFFCLLFFLSTASAKDEFYKIIKISDGDSFYADFNKNGYPDKNERIRVNGIDAFEVSKSFRTDNQAKYYNLTLKEALGLGYLGKEFAKEKLLDKEVKIKYTSNTKFDKYNRSLVSIEYDCNSFGICKSYEKEILKEGLAAVYHKSNLSNKLLKYENKEKIKANAIKTRELNLRFLDKTTNEFYDINSFDNCKNYCELVNLN